MSNCKSDKEETIFLLKEVNSGCKSATNSMEQVLEYVKDDNLKELIHRSNKEHVKIGDECHVMLNKYCEDEKDPNKISAAMAHMGTQIKLMAGADNSKIAGMLMDGCNMGIQSLSGYMNQYPCASNESMELAKRLVREEENFMMALEKYL